MKLEDVTEHFDKDGQRHRTDGPAIESNDGRYQHWYEHGMTHRTDGPAIIRNFQLNIEVWCEYGRYHRLGAPAVVRQKHNTTSVEWWIDGIQYSLIAYIEELISTHAYTQTDADEMVVITKLQYGAE